jgi:uroporphyrinogen decarboxylase
MRLKRPDRVPVMCQPSIGFLLRQCPDIDPIELWHDQGVYAEALCRVSARFGFDGVLISMHGNAPLDSDAVADIDRDYKEGPKVTYRNGDTTVYCRNDLPRHSYADHHPAEIETFDLGVIDGTVRFQPVSNDLNVQVADEPDERVKAIREVRRRIGEDYSVHGELYAPFDYFIELFGTEGGLMALLLEPGKSREIMERFAHAVATFAHEQIDAGVDAMKLSSPWTGQKFISLDMYRETIVPGQAIIAAACAERNVPIYCHTCGHIDDRLETIIESGYNGLECLDPPPLGNTRLEDAIERIGDRAFIKGNIDPVNTLLNGTPQVIEEDALRRLEIGMQARGFILSTACAIAPDTPAEHLAILAELAKKHGTY